MAARCGQPGRGAALCRDALRFSDAIGDRAGSAQALNFLAAISREESDLATAASRYADALTHAREIGELWATCSALDGIAAVACALGEPELAVHLFARSSRLADHAGYASRRTSGGCATADIVALMQVLGERDYERAAAEGELMSASPTRVASALAFARRHAPV